MRSAIFMLLIAVAVAVTNSDAPAQQSRTLTRSDYEKLAKNPHDAQALADLMAKLPTVEIEHEGVKRTYHIIEGDLLVGEERARAALRYHAQGVAPPPKKPGELLIMTDERERPVFWPRENRQLTYAVHRASFSNPDSYQAVIEAMREAAQEWEHKCRTCGLTIRHRPEFDDAPRLDQVTFIVTFTPNATEFIAAAFFPNDPEHRRYLLIAPSFFTTSYTKVGVLRHELGHVLGYRHEHIQGVPGCGQEDNQWKRVTDYDGKSVMHYFCGGGGTMELTISDLDEAGHAETYR